MTLNRHSVGNKRTHADQLFVTLRARIRVSWHLRGSGTGIASTEVTNCLETQVNGPLRILHLEDDPDFSDLVRSLLEKDGISVELILVSNQADFERILKAEQFDIVLADYLLPDYTGLDALRHFRQKSRETPFLLVSGTIGEQAAIDSLRAGATDYVLKQWPERLVPALRRAMQEAAERQQRRQAETELHRREKYFRALTENTLDTLTILSREGVYLYNNPSLKRVLGYDPKEVVGHNALTRVHPEDFEKAKAAFAEAIDHPERTVKVEFRFRHKDGSWRYLEAVGQSHLDDPEIGGVVINSRDVTDRKVAEAGLRELENQLRHSQKMEAIGQLAGGVAHDFNNILTVIHGHASLLLQNASVDQVGTKSARQIAEAAERAAGLTRQLLTFSRRQVMQPRRLNMNDVVSKMTDMLSRLLGEDIALQVNYFTGRALVQADASMIEQVLLNLAVNSRDAMPQGGVLAIAISVHELKNSDCFGRSEARPGKFVCLSVSDRGCGIPEQNLPRIFEPFFTTKEVGKGTGLGLATVYGIVKQHQGWIEVESKLNQGATFKVFLPCTIQDQVCQEEHKTELVAPGGSETILVVEDEAPVRELVCEVLARYGYEVIPAESGIRALELWPACRDRVDLMLTDLVMPNRVNGRQLAEKLRGDRPDLKVIFTSGYSSEAVGQDFVLQSGVQYLQKPYPPNRLALKIRECLDSAGKSD